MDRSKRKSNPQNFDKKCENGFKIFLKFHNKEIDSLKIKDNLSSIGVKKEKPLALSFKIEANGQYTMFNLI